MIRLQTMPNYTIGQKLWFVPTHYRPYEVTITKVGRKWLETNTRYRFDKDTLAADGGEYSSPGWAYLSEKAWREEQAMIEAWSQFRHWFWELRRPPGLTLEKLERVKAILRGEE